MARVIQWLFSRVVVIYLVVFIFCLTCVDFKMLQTRIKVRHLNDAIPNFSDMIIFSKGLTDTNNLDWKPYKDYFGLILQYMPDDLVTRQLLGYVDYYTGQQEEAIGLFKSADSVNGQTLFWPDYNLGVIYYKKGMWPQSVEYLLKAATSNLKLSLIVMQGSIVYKQILLSYAFHYNLSDEIKDAQGRAYILLLSSLQHMGQFDKMLVISSLALANKDIPYKDAFYYYGGIAFLKMGQVQKAFLFFQKSLSIEKYNPDVYYYIANIYQSAGQTQQARDFAQASSLLHQKNDPRFPYGAQAKLRFF